MSILKLVALAAGSLIGMLCIGGFLAATRINTIRIGGPEQIKIQQVSDIVADILPPPEYVLEPYFEATALLRKLGEISCAMSIMDQSTQQNAAMVEETSAATHNLSSEVVQRAAQSGCCRRFTLGEPSARNGLNSKDIDFLLP